MTLEVNDNGIDHQQKLSATTLSTGSWLQSVEVRLLDLSGICDTFNEVLVFDLLMKIWQ